VQKAEYQLGRAGRCSSHVQYRSTRRLFTSSRTQVAYRLLLQTQPLDHIKLL